MGLAAFGALGLAVGKGSTALDDWFFAVGDAHPVLGRLLFFTDGRILVVLAALLLAAALRRRRFRLAAVVALTPLVAIAAARLAKIAFGRERGGALAYPSGHTTLAVVVLGSALLVVGTAWWSVAAALAWTVFAMLGQSFTYHYFTDAVGGVLLASALLWVAARIDRCQPGCDLRHSGG